MKNLESTETQIHIYIIDDIVTNLQRSPKIYGRNTKISSQSDVLEKYKREFTSGVLGTCIHTIQFKNEHQNPSLILEMNLLCAKIAAHDSLVFMDLDMGDRIEGHQVGLAMARKIITINPRVNIVFTSAFDEVERKERADEIRDVIGDGYVLFQGKINLTLGNPHPNQIKIMAGIIDQIKHQNSTTKHLAGIISELSMRGSGSEPVSLSPRKLESAFASETPPPLESKSETAEILSLELDSAPINPKGILEAPLLSETKGVAINKEEGKEGELPSTKISIKKANPVRTCPMGCIIL